MSNYREMYQQGKENNSNKQLTPEYLKFREKGQDVVGVFVAKVSVASNLSDGEYNQYLFETDDGLVKFAMGKQADSEIGMTLVKGCIYRIAYGGQIELKGGHRVNKFTCEQVGVDETVE